MIVGPSMRARGVKLSFLDRRVLLITGKGGVGRTTVTVALGRAAARTGKKVLLLEVGDPGGGPSGIGAFFGHRHLLPEAQQVEENLSVAHMWARRGHELFLQSVLPGKNLIRAAVRSKAVERFLIAAPSLHEMGLFYHVLTQLEARDAKGDLLHELIIIDMPATGHALALTGLPDILLKLIPGGPIARALKQGQSYFNNPEKGEAWVVTLPEKLPVTEAIELVGGLQETGVTAGGFILNRVPENPFSEAELNELENLIPKAGFHGQLALDRIRSAGSARKRLTADLDLPVIELPERDEAIIEGLTERLVEQVGEL